APGAGHRRCDLERGADRSGDGADSAAQGGARRILTGSRDRGTGVTAGAGNFAGTGTGTETGTGAGRSVGDGDRAVAGTARLAPGDAGSESSHPAGGSAIGAGADR